MAYERPSPAFHDRLVRNHRGALLLAAGVHHVGLFLDVRLNNRSQLLGFSKAGDLKFLADRIAGIGYVHVPSLVPANDRRGAILRHGPPRLRSSAE